MGKGRDRTGAIRGGSTHNVILFTIKPKMNRLFALFLSLVTWQRAFGQSGSLLDTNLSSHFFGWDRGVHIYLPPSYPTQPQRRYPVL